LADRIGGARHDDGNGAGRLPHGRQRCRRSQHEDIDLQSHKFGCDRRKAAVISQCSAPLDDEILPLDIAEFAHALREPTKKAQSELRRGRCTEDEADAPHSLGLLRARRERPRGRAAE
jgi:hypothetical protein